MAYRGLTHISEAVGKTVASVVEWSYGDDWLVLFTDGTYARFGIEFGYYGDRTTLTGTALGDYELFTPDGVEAGLCTSEEADAYNRGEKARMAEIKQAQEENEQARERELYEHLKSKYGGA